MNLDLTIAMTITVEHLGIRCTHHTDAQIENEILRLQDEITIEEVRVRLERRCDCAPAFRVHLHLVTPGPDIHVEAADHTLDAARLKALAELKRRIAAKRMRRSVRVKSNLQSPALQRGRTRRGGYARAVVR